MDLRAHFGGRVLDIAEVMYDSSDFASVLSAKNLPDQKS